MHAMKRTSIPMLTAVFLIAAGPSHAQVSGNANFGQSSGRAVAEQREHAKHVIAKDDQPPSATSMFVEANVLMNVRADLYVAVFAVAHEGVPGIPLPEVLDVQLAGDGQLGDQRRHRGQACQLVLGITGQGFLVQAGLGERSEHRGARAASSR